MLQQQRKKHGKIKDKYLEVSEYTGLMDGKQDINRNHTNTEISVYLSMTATSHDY